METETITCTAWRSDALPETYLLVDEKSGLERVPDELLARFRNPKKVTSFDLGAKRQLANADTAEVLRSICDRGFYLQLPAGRDTAMSAVAGRNQKMTG